jgi:hypothetical protein
MNIEVSFRCRVDKVSRQAYQLFTTLEPVAHIYGVTHRALRDRGEKLVSEFHERRRSITFSPLFR